VRVPAYGLGWTAADVLVTLIEGEEEVSSVFLETELVIRESCGAKQAEDSGAPAVSLLEGYESPAPSNRTQTT
jgi:hypothetical protein